jgi:serine/threonine protein kinase
MPLSPGVRLGPYEILDAIGAGGMGEVYRARDAKLGRDVALKVLPEEFTQFAARVARLRREAQVLASLNHPHIASIYGFEDSGTVHALVMELVEGPTLAERIKQGAIPLDEALPLAKQICEAVEYAHERGIVHRDLKPSNVKITPEGNVKVLDFGLAKALEGDAAMDISSSPTLSAAATRAGFLMGTAAYMSPEQARGKNADRRSDIWAFGVVLFEILSGKRLFNGETTSDMLAEVLKMEPEWGALPANTPARLRELLARCLKKNARQRLQSIGDARIELDEISSGTREVGSVLAGSGCAGSDSRANRMGRCRCPYYCARVSDCRLLRTCAATRSCRRRGYPAAGGCKICVCRPAGRASSNFSRRKEAGIHCRRLGRQAAPLDQATQFRNSAAPRGNSRGSVSFLVAR